MNLYQIITKEPSMSNVATPESNIALFESFGFKIPNDQHKLALLSSLLDQVKNNAPSKITFNTLIQDTRSTTHYIFDAVVTYSADTNQLILNVKGSLSLEDQSNIVTIQEIEDTNLSIYELGSLAAPIELFTDCSYTTLEIRNASIAVFSASKEIFKSNFLRKYLLGM